MGFPASSVYRLLPVTGRLYRAAGIPGREEAIRSWAPTPVRAAAERVFGLGVAFGVWLACTPDPIPEGFLEEETRRIAARPEIMKSLVRISTGDPCSQLKRQAALIRAPALVIHGDSDRAVPIRCIEGIVRELERVVPVRFERLRGAGHLRFLIRPADVHVSIERWLRSHSPAPA